MRDGDVERLCIFEDCRRFLEDGVHGVCAQGGEGELILAVFEQRGDVGLGLSGGDVGRVVEDMAGGAAATLGVGGDTDGVELLVEGGIDGFLMGGGTVCLAPGHWLGERL